MKFLAYKRYSSPLRGWRRAFALSALALGLSACTAFQNLTDKISDPIVLKCPDYWVIADAASVVKFKDGPGRDLVDVDFEGKIVGVELGCLSDIDRRSKTGTMEVDVTLRMVASRGPANRGRKARFDYFIRVLDPDFEPGPDKKPLMAEDLVVVIDFPGNKTRIRFRTPPFTMVLPITPKWPSRYYRIFAGFKLTREELQFNRGKIRNAGGTPGR